MRQHNLILRLAFVGAALAFSTEEAFSWGQKGHDVVCTVAQNHLTPKAKKEISKILDGQSIIYWANWLDNASHTPEFSYTKTWHYRNIDAGQQYETAPRNDKGDVVSAINQQITTLKNKAASKEEHALALRILIHLTGDLHNPMHMGHKSDLGGNKWQVQYFRAGKNLHGIWDTDVLESSHKWSHTEWAEEIDRTTRKEIADIVKGTPEDWGRETWLIATEIYDSTPVGSKLSYDYVSKWAPTIEQELLRGGLRLASLLNDIYR